MGIDSIAKQEMPPQGQRPQLSARGEELNRMSKGEDEGQHLTCGRLIISMAWERGGREGKNTCKRIEKHQRERPPLRIKSAKTTSRVKSKRSGLVQKLIRNRVPPLSWG